MCSNGLHWHPSSSLTRCVLMDMSWNFVFFFSPDIFSVKWPKLVLKCVSYLGKLTHEMQHFSRFLECKTVYMQLIVSDDVYITKKIVLVHTKFFPTFLHLFFAPPNKNSYAQSEIHNKEQQIVTKYSAVHDAQSPRVFLSAHFGTILFSIYLFRSPTRCAHFSHISLTKQPQHFLLPFILIPSTFYSF